MRALGRASSRRSSSHRLRSRVARASRARRVGAIERARDFLLFARRSASASAASSSGIAAAPSPARTRIDAALARRIASRPTVCSLDVAAARSAPSRPSLAAAPISGAETVTSRHIHARRDDGLVESFADGTKIFAPRGFERALFAECGFGADQHGQDATKAAVRACRNAIEFNSVPSVRAVVPGGYAKMKIHVQLGVPENAKVDAGRVREVFPYGEVVDVQIDTGGLRARSWISIPAQGDANDDFLICVACVTVGY